MSTLEIIVTVISGISALFGLFGIGAYINERAKHRASRRNDLEDRREIEEEEKKEKALRKVIREELKPLEEKLDKNTKSTITSLRCDMKIIVDRCQFKGFASVSEKANWKDLYNDYKGLGGNHFKEYVDEWKKEIEELPTEAPKKKRTTKKQVLLENKK